MSRNRTVFMIAGIIVSIFSVVSASGQTESCSGQTLTLQTAAKSGYVVKNGNLANTNPVSQSDVAVEFCNGVSADAWFSASSTGVDETDFTGKWQVKKLTLVGEYNQFSNNGGNVFQPYATLALPTIKFKFQGLSISPWVEVDGILVTKETRKNSTAFVMGGFHHDWAIHGKTLTLQQEIYALRDIRGAFGGPAATIGSYCPRLKILAHGLVFEPGIRATFGSAAGKQHLVGFLQVSRSFNHLHIF